MCDKTTFERKSLNRRTFINSSGLLWTRLYTNWNRRLNYFGFVLNQVDKIKHQDCVFQKVIGHYYRKKTKRVLMTWKKNHVVKEAITPPIVKKKIDTINKTGKPQASKRKKINPSEINKSKVNHWINQGLLQKLRHMTH